MSEHTYQIIELVGSSSVSIEEAVSHAIRDAQDDLETSDLDWFEVKEIRGRIENGAPAWFQVVTRIGSRYA